MGWGVGLARSQVKVLRVLPSLFRDEGLVILCPFQQYDSHTRIMRLCAMEPVITEKIQSTGLKPGSASPAG